MKHKWLDEATLVILDMYVRVWSLRGTGDYIVDTFKLWVWRASIIIIRIPNYFVDGPLLQSLGLTRVNQLTPTAKRLYKMVKAKDQVNRRLTAQLRTLKEHKPKVIRQKDVADVDWLQAQGLKKVNAEFVKAQLTLCGKNPRSRRYNTCLKLMGIALLKKSPAQYKLFQKIFAVPSRKTLDRVRFTGCLLAWKTWKSMK